ncbi:MAG TPA: hypothetical protein VGK38_12085 [Prolixibacteraceae bacterium]|jgi:hypothetical protein
MENEEKVSCELVPVEEVDTELVFAPQGESQLIGYGSRKIIRESIRNQLRDGYKCLDYNAVELEDETTLSKRDSNVLAIVNVLVDGVYTKKEIAAKTQLTETQIGYVLNVLLKFEFVEIIKIGRTFYYKILLNE